MESLFLIVVGITVVAVVVRLAGKPGRTWADSETDGPGRGSDSGGFWDSDSGNSGSDHPDSGDGGAGDGD